MGDRANVAVIQDNGQAVFLYTHSDGHELACTVQKALSRKARWDDEPYLTRIIFDAMTAAYPRGGETGFGISTCIGDSNHKVIVVNPQKQTVGFVPDKGPLLETLEPLLTWSFTEFVTLDSSTLDKLWMS